jgi:hypothetical protein
LERIFCALGICAANSQSAKNRAFRSKSSEAPMRFLWAFRFNAPEDGRFPIGMDCSGRYRAPGIPCAAQRANLQNANSRPPPCARLKRLSHTLKKKFTTKPKTDRSEDWQRRRRKK